MKTGDIHKIIRPLGIRLLDGSEHSPSIDRTRACFCRRTLRRVLNQQGEGHLSLVLKVIVQSRGNETELYRDTILAVSGLLSTHKEADISSLFDAMDGIDLANLRKEAKECGVKPVHHALQALLSREVHSA